MPLPLALKNENNEELKKEFFKKKISKNVRPDTFRASMGCVNCLLLACVSWWSSPNAVLTVWATPP